MRVSVPASSANLGPGFDCLGMALELPLWCSTEVVDDLVPVDEHHPASVAFVRAGGVGTVALRSPIPPGRGLGFSGAARVAGALLGSHVADPHASEADLRRRALEVATSLEGHPDNAAASMVGGITVAVVDDAPGSGVTAVGVACPLDLEVVVWWPDSTSSTARSRATLPAEVSRSDAVHNLGRSSLLVAALAAGDRRAIGVAVNDRLHQELRLASLPASQAAYVAAQECPETIAVWLSGSGPTIAAFADAGDGAAAVAAALPEDGTVRRLRIDRRGATLD